LSLAKLTTSIYHALDATLKVVYSC